MSFVQSSAPSGSSSAAGGGGGAMFTFTNTSRRSSIASTESVDHAIHAALAALTTGPAIDGDGTRSRGRSRSRSRERSAAPSTSTSPHNGHGNPGGSGFTPYVAADAPATARRTPILVPRSLTPLYITESPLLAGTGALSPPSAALQRMTTTPTPVLPRTARPHSAGPRRSATPTSLMARGSSTADVSHQLDNADLLHSPEQIDRYVVGDFAVTSPVIVSSGGQAKVGGGVSV